MHFSMYIKILYYTRTARFEKNANISHCCFRLFKSIKSAWIPIWWLSALTHWCRVTHICVSNLTFIGSDNGLSPGRRQANIWTKAGILLIGPSGTNFSEILIEILAFSFKKMRLKASSAKWQPYCLGLNVLTSPSPRTRNDVTGCSWYCQHIQRWRGWRRKLSSITATANTRCPFYKHILTLIPSWTSNHMLSNAWNEITCPFPNCYYEVWKWISNFILTGHMVTYPCCDQS